MIGPLFGMGISNDKWQYCQISLTLLPNIVAAHSLSSVVPPSLQGGYFGRKSF
jgi:hypothetical protein